jgi:hypothetical protein
MPTNNATNTSNPISVAQGGTGDSSLTAYAVLCGGTSSTGVIQSVASVGSSGNVLTSNGAGALPTFQPASGSSAVLSVSGQLTSAQIKTLHGSPVQAIPAPGAGKFIFVISAATSYVYGGTNAFTAGAAQTINIYYGSASNIVQMVTNGAITGTANAIAYQYALAVSSGTGVNAVNAPVNFYNPIATEIAGNAANNNVVNYTIVYFIASQ